MIDHMLLVIAFLIALVILVGSSSLMLLAFVNAVAKMQEGYLTAINAQHVTLGRTVADTSTAVGKAVSLSLVPPITPADAQEERLSRVVHDLADRLAPPDDVDDSDPTDMDIQPHRDSAIYAAVGGEVAPGIRMPAPLTIVS